MEIDQTPIQSFAPESRVWIFQSLQRLTPDQQVAISTRLKHFVSQWKAHQAPVTAAFGIYFDHVLVIAADAAGNPTTGCAIDSMYQEVQDLAQSIQIDVMDRLHIPVLQDNDIQFMTRKQLQHALHEGSMDEGTLILDQTVQDVDAWIHHWAKPVGQSWVMQRIPVRPA